MNGGRFDLQKERQKWRTMIGKAVLVLCGVLTISNCCYIFPKGTWTSNERNDDASPYILKKEILNFGEILNSKTVRIRAKIEKISHENNSLL